MRRILLALRAEMVRYLQRPAEELHYCGRCLLPFPEGDFDAYDFCPWCAQSTGGLEPRIDESRKIVGETVEEWVAIQCGECGSEYAQPARYPYRFCVVCGAPFAAEDEYILELPWLV